MTRHRSAVSISVASFITALCICLSQPMPAYGAGFALIEQSASGLGNAFAGGAASAEDASTIFFNPAGLSRLQGTQVIAAGHIIMPSAKFHNEGSTHVLQGKTGVPLLGGDGGEGGVSRLVPNLYISKRLSEKVTVGLGVSAPFGLATDYDRDWVGRYHALESDVMTVNINPSAAYKINDRISVGGGLNIQYMKAKLSSAIDFGTLDAAGAFSALGLAPGALKLIPQKSDGFVELEGDSWGIGYNLGLLFSLSDNTRAGLAYRSSILQSLEGDAEFSNTPAGLAKAPVFKNSGIKAGIRLPDTFSASVYHRINTKWAVMADVTWTNWSMFKELRVKFDNQYQQDSVTTTKWKDNYRYSAGVTFTPDPAWTFRGGIAYDETPIESAVYRTPRIPDGNRWWLAGGLGYKLSKQLSVDAGYTHLFVNDPQVSKSAANDEDKLRGGLKGTYSAHVDIVSAQLTWSF